MRRTVAFPFLTLSDSAVRATPWEISINDGNWRGATRILSGWDLSTTTRIRRSIELNMAIAAADLAISEDELSLSMTVKIGTGSGRFPKTIIHRHRTAFDKTITERSFEFEVPGRALSNRLALRTDFSLGATPRAPGSLSPQRLGDRLWADELHIDLEGSEPRFPMEMANLGVLLGSATASRAPWYLHWSPKDWDRDFHGSVRLYLDDRDTAVLSRINSEDPSTLQILLGDIMGQICERFVLDPEAPEVFRSAEPGSLGAQASSWLRKAWPGQDIAYIRSVLEARPGVFYSSFLALAELKED
jgi:hypothetical protein